MTDKIESLTAGQEARLPEFVERWTQIGLSTEPADRPRAESAIRKMYALAGLAPPRMIVWCGSPVSLGLARAITFDGALRERIEAFGSHGISESIWRSISASVEVAGGTGAGYCFRNHVMQNVLMSVFRSVGASVGEGVWTRVFETVRVGGWDDVADSVFVWDDVRAAWGNGADTVLANTDRKSVV